MSGITPPLTHIQCNPSAFFLSAAYHVPVRPNSAEAGNLNAVVRDEWVKPVKPEWNTTHCLIPLYQHGELVRLIPQRPHIPHDDRWYSWSMSPLLPPLFYTGSAAPASPLQLLWDHRPGSGQQRRFTQQCRFTQSNQLVACVNNTLNDALLTLHC